MRNKLLFLVLLISLTMAFCLSASAMTGSGTENDPYIVEASEDFTEINSNTSAHYKLANDISLSSTTGFIVENFSGTFDGNGKTITLEITGKTSGKHTFDALFGVVSGYIKNLTVKGNVSGSDKVAGVVGKLTGGNVDNCVNYATITGRKNIGGIVGLITGSGTVTNCINRGEINGHSPIDKGLDMGGIVGCVWDVSDANAVIVSNCYNEGTIAGEGYNAGGVMGHVKGGKYKNLFNVGKVSVTTNFEHIGEIVAEISNEWWGTYYVDGYFATNERLVGYTNSRTFTATSPMLLSSGVAIYLGAGSGIRGEFHLNENVFESFYGLVSTLGYDVEYGAVVSTKDILASVGDELLLADNAGIVFAPAIKNGEKQYGYNDEDKGDGYHSYRFALTGFDNTTESYNREFVILGYVSIKNGTNKEIFPINTVKSDRLASELGETGLNAVSIVRVAKATLDDGDFEGNDSAISKLSQIVGFMDMTNKISIDGVVGYGHKNAKFTKNVSSDDTVVFNITNTDEEEFTIYVNNLVKADYEKIFENTIEGICFYTYQKDTALIHISRTVSTNDVRISYETVTSLPSFTEPSYTKVAQPSVTQLTQQASINEGMSYVIELSDGSFFIVDGGWCDSNANEADRLYNQLVTLAGEGNDIVIAGWIFTHCHGDHIGTFNFFVEKYHDSVTIKELLYNFPSDSDIASSGSYYMLDNSAQRYSKFRSVISTYLTDTKIVKLHSGYKFYYADLEVEILQTLEDLYPSTVANYDFNSSSTIFTVKIAGQKMLFLGDTSDVGAKKLNSSYTTALKSDFVQIAHHGLNNSGEIKTIYENAQAEYVFFPTSESWFNQYSGSGANNYLVYESKTVKQVFVSYKASMTLALPYDGTEFDGARLPYFDIIIPEDPDKNEVDRPTTSVTVPDAYFDLDLSSGTPTDASGNATVTVKGGSVTETTVSHNDKEATVDAFTGDKNNGSYYLTLNFNDIKTDAQMGEFVMGSSTFEIFLKFDNLPKKTVGLITSCNGGGFTLYMRKETGQINFQIGSTNPNANSDGGAGKGNYSAVTPMNTISFPVIEADTLVHIVSTYDSATNTMKLYINGILVASADYGTGSFKGGSKADYVVGIGYNPQYSSEEISSYADYELYDAKIYNTALTDEQVAQEYWNCIDNLFK